MANKQSKVYQSGQEVPKTGYYEVAGAKPKVTEDEEDSTVREFTQGELFPNYEGRAVTWHPRAEKPKPASKG